MKQSYRDARVSQKAIVNELERSLSPKNVLNSLFSKQFLGNLKSELNQKVKSSNNIQSPEQVDSIKAQKKIKLERQMMSRKIKQLTKENQQLRKKVKQLNLSTSKSLTDVEINKNNIFTTTVSQKLRIHSQQVNVSLNGNQLSTAAIQMKKLKSRILQLQATKNVKEQRLSELLQKQARYQGQILLLRTKQRCLADQVQDLKQSIRVQLVQLQKPLRGTNLTEKQQILQGNLAGKIRDKLTSNILGVTQKSVGLFQSNCMDIVVPDHLHLSKMQTKQLSRVLQDNEIDNMLEEELPYISSIDIDSPQAIHFKRQRQLDLKTMGVRQQNPGSQISQISSFNVNSSMVAIDLNAIPAAPKKDNQINQSLVSINF